MSEYEQLIDMLSRSRMHFHERLFATVTVFDSHEFERGNVVDFVFTKPNGDLEGIYVRDWDQDDLEALQ